MKILQINNPVFTGLTCHLEAQVLQITVTHNNEWCSKNKTLSNLATYKCGNNFLTGAATDKTAITLMRFTLQSRTILHASGEDNTDIKAISGKKV